MSNRYSIQHPRTVTVTVETMQRVGDFLSCFKNSPDFHEYRVIDTQTGRTYKPQISAVLNGIEINEVLETGYLQHGEGTRGPFRTESVKVKYEHGDRYLAWFEGRWRRVHFHARRTFIVYQGEKITIRIERV